jgi:hypothetical protein
LTEETPIFTIDDFAVDFEILHHHLSVRSRCSARSHAVTLAWQPSAAVLHAS